MRAGRQRAVRAGFAAVLVQIGLMDLSLSIDNVIAAVGLAPRGPGGDPVMWPIYLGVLIAIVALQLIAPHAVTLLKQFPILEPTAFVLIGYVGVLLMAEETIELATGTARHLPAYAKFAGILLIIGVALLYDRTSPVRRLLRPLVRAARLPLRGIARAGALLVSPATLLLDRVWRAEGDQ